MQRILNLQKLDFDRDSDVFLQVSSSSCNIGSC